MNFNRKLLYQFLFIIVATIISCKPEEIIIDKTAITVQTLDAGELKSTQVTLYGEIGYLNDETVLDHGFIIRTLRSSESKIISLGNKPELGIVKHTLMANFEIGQGYNCTYYLKTDQKTYEGNPVYFTVNDIYVDNAKVRYSSIGDTMSIAGNFHQVDASFKLLLGTSYTPVEVAYKLDAKKEKLTFVIPNKEFYHGDKIRVSFSKNIQEQQFTQYLCDLTIAARLLPPKVGPHYFYQPIELKATALPRYNDSFKIIINNKVLRFESEIYPSTLDLKGSSYKLGYIWGKDTIYLKETWDFEKPDMSRVSFLDKIIHPHGHTDIMGLDYDKYLLNSKFSAKIGNAPGYFDSNLFEGNIGFRIEEVADGKYPVSLISDVYGELKINELLTVQKLKINSVDVGEGYYEDPIRIKGNFLPNQVYTISLDGQQVYFGQPIAGDLVFPCPFQFTKGKNMIEIGYSNYGGNPFIIDTRAIQINGIEIKSFYPTQGAPGDLVTIKAKGLNSNYYQIGIGGMATTPLSVKNGEAQFIIPIVSKRGKTKISFYVDGREFRSTDDFEII